MHYINVPVYWPYEKDITYKGRLKLENCKLINETLSHHEKLAKFEDSVSKIRFYKNVKLRDRDLKIFLSVFGVKDKLTIAQVCERFHLSGERVGNILYRLYCHFLKINEEGKNES